MAPSAEGTTLALPLAPLELHAHSPLLSIRCATTARERAPANRSARNDTPGCEPYQRSEASRNVATDPLRSRACRLGSRDAAGGSSPVAARSLGALPWAAAGRAGCGGILGVMR